MRQEEDDEDIPPPTAELDAYPARGSFTVAEPVRAPPPRSSLITHVGALALGFALGVVGLYTAERLLAELGPPRTEPSLPVEVSLPQPPAPVAARGLRSLDGRDVRVLPSGRVQLVNVWLEGCADCMPSFEAWRKHVADETLPSGVPISNVAFVRATEDYARRYRVLEGLVVDDGSNLVRPLGITRFTTLVVGPAGEICHRDDPAKPGYADRLAEAVRRCGAADWAGPR